MIFYYHNLLFLRNTINVSLERRPNGGRTFDRGTDRGHIITGRLAPPTIPQHSWALETRGHTIETLQAKQGHWRGECIEAGLLPLRYERQDTVCVVWRLISPFVFEERSNRGLALDSVALCRIFPPSAYWGCFDGENGSPVVQTPAHCHTRSVSRFDVGAHSLQQRVTHREARKLNFEKIMSCMVGPL